MASERHQVILSDAATDWVRAFSKEERHSISKTIAILVEEAIQGRMMPGPRGGTSEGNEFTQFLREKFAMDFEIWKHARPE